MPNPFLSVCYDEYRSMEVLCKTLVSRSHVSWRHSAFDDTPACGLDTGNEQNETATKMEYTPRGVPGAIPLLTRFWFRVECSTLVVLRRRKCLTKANMFFDNEVRQERHLHYKVKMFFVEFFNEKQNRFL